MRIAIVTRQYPPDTGGGGVATYYATLAPALCQAGYDVTVITRGYPSRSYEEQGVHVIRIGSRHPLPGISRALRLVSLHHLLYQWPVDSVLTDLRPDVVLTLESLADCAWYLARPRRRRAPVVVQLMTGIRMLSQLNPMPLRYFGGWALVPLEEWVVRRADYLSSLSRAMAEWARPAFRLGARHVEVIANPVDTVLFRPGSELPDPHNILYVGRLEWGKGCHVLAQAIGRVASEFPNVHARFVGKDTPTAPGRGSMKDYLERLLSRDGVLTAVSFAGPRPQVELPHEYRSATVCVVPSFWETFCNVCLEAMACGRPVIASRVGGLTEAVEDGRTGVLVPPGDADALAAQILRLLRDREAREALGRAARNAAESRFRPDLIASKMGTFLESVVSGPHQDD